MWVDPSQVGQSTLPLACNNCDYLNLIWLLWWIPGRGHIPCAHDHACYADNDSIGRDPNCFLHLVGKHHHDNEDNEPSPATNWKVKKNAAFIFFKIVEELKFNIKVVRDKAAEGRDWQSLSSFISEYCQHHFRCQSYSWWSIHAYNLFIHLNLFIFTSDLTSSW